MAKILLTTGKMIIKICIFIKHKNKKLVKTENSRSEEPELTSRDAATAKITKAIFYKLKLKK